MLLDLQTAKRHGIDHPGELYSIHLLREHLGARWTNDLKFRSMPGQLTRLYDAWRVSWPTAYTETSRGPVRWIKLLALPDRI